MSEQQHSQTPTQTQEGSDTAGKSNLNADRGNRSERGTGGRGRGFQGNYRQRRATNIQAVIDTDKNFEGVTPGIGVIGLPSEKILRYALQLEDFYDAIMAYVGNHYEKGSDLKPLIMNLEDPSKYLETVDDKIPDKDTEPGKYELWKISMQRIDKRNELLKDNRKKLFTLVFGQCTNAMQAEIKTDKKYRRKERSSDSLWLLQTIKKISSGILTRKNEVQTYVTQVRETFNMTMKPTETVDAYQKRLMNKMQTLELAGGAGVFCPDLKNLVVSESEMSDYSDDELSSDEYDTPDEGETIQEKTVRLKLKIDKHSKRKLYEQNREQRKKEWEANKEKRMEVKTKRVKRDLVQSMVLLQLADRMRFGDRYNELDAATDVGRDEFPRTYHEAVDLMSMTDQRHIDNLNRNQGRSGRGGGASFAQTGGGTGRGITGRGNGGRGNGDSNRDRNVPRTPDGYRCIPNGEPIIPGRDGTVCNYQCWTCNAWGHTNQNGNCPRQEDVSMHVCVNSVHFNNTIDSFYLKPSIYLLDSAATHSTVKSTSNLTNLTSCNYKDSLFTLTNAGSLTFNFRGDLNFLPLRPHCNTDSMANILALHEVNALDGCYVRFMGDREDAFYVFFKCGRIIKFPKCNAGLYYYDLERLEDHEFNIDFGFVQTAEENAAGFSDNEKKKMALARYYQELFAWPSKEDMVKIVEEKQIKNSKIGKEDILATDKILGKAKAEIRGKMKRRSPKIHRTKIPGKLPEHLKGREIELYVDVFTGSKCSFLITKAGSRLKHFKAKYLYNKKISNVTKIVRETITRYEDRGFKVAAVHADNAFDNEQMRTAIGSRVLHIYAREEHVGVIERQIRSLKERLRSVLQGLPYKKYPKLMFIAMVDHVVEMMNRFVTKNGLSDTLSPAELVEGVDKIDLSHRQILFGSYAEVWDGTTNTMKARSVPCIALNRSNNAGGFYFMSLDTGKRHNSNQWEELPVTEEIISKVENLTNQRAVMEVILQQLDTDLKVKYRDSLNEEESVTTADITEDEQSQEDRNLAEGVVPREEDDNAEDQPLVIPDDCDIVSEDSCIDNSELMVREEDVVSDLGVTVIDNESIANLDENEANDSENMNIDGPEIEDDGLVIDKKMDDSSIKEDNISSTFPQHDTITNDKNLTDEEPTLRRSKRRVKRGQDYLGESFAEQYDKIYCKPQQQKVQDYGHTHFQNKYGFDTVKTKYMQACSFLQQKIEKEKESYVIGSRLKTAVEACFASIPATQGLKKYGEKAVAVMLKELKQLNDGAVKGKPVVIPIDVDSLTEQDRQQALDAVNLIEQKRDNRLKGRTCANGSKQRYYLDEFESVASPTVGLESLMTTLMIGAYEGRKTISFDIPGAFLQAEMSEEKLVLLKMKGRFVDMMCDINSEHRKNVTYEVGKNGKAYKVLYMKVIRAIYGCIEAALQWYKLFTETLQDLGFKLNSYDKCIANKFENGKQCTIAWHVDDCIATHVEQAVLDNLGKKMIKHFGEMEINTGNKHDFLGMNIVINDDRTVSVEMQDQIDKAINWFEEESGTSVDDTVSTPATGNLFKVNLTASELDREKSKVFHTTTAKLLYIMKRARPDIETAVSYLMRRVSKSDEDDWQKLRRCLGFLKKTITDVRVIGAKSLSHLFTWIDASYAVHDNMRSHLGGIMSMGVGVIHAKSSMNKVNTKSTTEAELVSVAEYLPYNIWFMHFMNEQGYELKDNVIYQDNKSAILMEKNGRNSCTGNSRHINIRYFWIKDKVDSGEVRVDYTPTHLMLADYFTKPLMGTLFIKLREYVMGWKPIEDLIISLNNSRIKEDVGICENQK